MKALTSEIHIHFPGKANLTKSVLAFPKLLVCLDCGLADVLLSEDELRNLKETYSSCSREILADTEYESPAKLDECNRALTSTVSSDHRFWPALHTDSGH